MLKQCLLCQEAIVFELTPMQVLGIQLIDPPAICQRCLQEFAPITSPHCPQCYKMGSSKLCSDCQLWQKQGYLNVRHRALFKYNNAMHDYFKRYKRYGDYALRACFQSLIHQKLRSFQGTVVYIPSSTEHLQQRHFDPVVGLFKEVVDLTPALIKLPTQQAQAQKNRRERLQTTQFLQFNHQYDSILSVKQILVVDDIYTTGRTILHAYDCLRQAGYQGEISSFSLAR